MDLHKLGKGDLEAALQSTSAALLGRLGISPDKTLRSLGCNQRRALIDELDGPPRP